MSADLKIMNTMLSYKEKYVVLDAMTIKPKLEFEISNDLVIGLGGFWGTLSI